MANNTQQELRNEIRSRLMKATAATIENDIIGSNEIMVIGTIIDLIEAECTRREQALLDELENFALEKAATLNALHIGHWVSDKRQSLKERKES